MEWRERLRAIIDDRGWGKATKQLCKEAGLGETFVRDILEYGKDPSVGKLLKLANKLGVSVAEILEGTPAASHNIRIDGRVEGEEWRQTNLHLQVDFRLQGETVTLEVGADPLPGYYTGDVIIGIKVPPANAYKFYGRECIVMTKDGQRHVRYLQRGASKNRFNLRSHSPTHKDLENVQIEWAAPITWVRRAPPR
jgi:transcriptional regulator with XRE-family HTH domain